MIESYFGEKKCSIDSCQNYSSAVIKINFSKEKNLHLCEECQQKIFESLSKKYVPKSIKNKFRNGK